MNTQDESPEVMLTIRCTAYNHEPYIRQCLEGFVMQKTNFRFEAIVHDDASTDGTAAIIRDYAEKYPDIIKPIYETENQYSKNDGSLRRIMDSHTKGKYVAMCEGDDYWTDPYKLQKQVDFLEEHPDFAICFHNVKIWKQREQRLVDDFITKDVAEVTSIVDLAEQNYIHTPSVVYRNNDKVSSDMLAIGRLPAGDYVLHMLNAQFGRIMKMPDCMAVYRYGSGLWSGQDNGINCNDYAWTKVLVALMKYYRQNDSVYEALSRQLIEIFDSLMVCAVRMRDDYLSFRNKKAYLLGKFLLKPFSRLRSFFCHSV